MTFPYGLGDRVLGERAVEERSKAKISSKCIEIVSAFSISVSISSFLYSFIYLSFNCRCKKNFQCNKLCVH